MLSESELELYCSRALTNMSGVSVYVVRVVKRFVVKLPSGRSTLL